MGWKAGQGSCAGLKVFNRGLNAWSNHAAGTRWTQLSIKSTNGKRDMRAVEAQLSQTLVHWAKQASERLNPPWDVQVMRPVPDAAQRAWLGADELLVALDPATNRLLRYEPCKLRSVLFPSLRMKLHPQPADRGAEGRGQDLGASVGRC